MLKVASVKIEDDGLIITLESDSREELVDSSALNFALSVAKEGGYFNCAIGPKTKGPAPFDAEDGSPIVMPTKPNTKIVYRRQIHCVPNAW
jgi:hypothetical protein